MAVNIRGKSDRQLKEFKKVLEAYEAAHPRAKIDLYRQADFCIKIRVIDPDFARIGFSDRHDIVWKHLEKVSEDTLAHLYVLLLLAPGETKKSLANMDFERPEQLELT